MNKNNKVKIIIIILLIGAITMGISKPAASVSEILSVLNKALGSPVPAIEIQQLGEQERRDRDLDRTIEGWINPGTRDPNFVTIYAEQGLFETVPTEALYLQRTTDFTLTTATDTAIVWETQLSQGESAYFSFDGEKIKVIPSVDFRTVLITGTVVFKSNATGYREVKINLYDSSDVLIASEELVRLNPVSGTFTVIPYMKGHIVNNLGGTEVAYYTITVKQTSGGDLDVSSANILISMVR